MVAEPVALPTVADILEAVSEQKPDAPAIISGHRVTTWRSFESRAERLASHFQQAGLSRQSKVAVYLRNGPEYLETVFASLKASMIPINVNYRYGVSELEYLFDNADVGAVVFDESFASLAAQLRERLPAIGLWYCIGDSDAVDVAFSYEKVVTSTGPTSSRSRAADDLMMIYTGGTTGLPKGVMWRQADLVPLLVAKGTKPGTPPPATIDDLLSGASSTDEVCLVACPLMHGTGLFMALATLLGGGTIVTTGGSFDPGALCDAVQRNKVTKVVLVGDPFARPLLATLDAGGRDDQIASLRTIVSAGAMWSQDVKLGLLRHHPGLTLVDSFGASEISGLGRSVSTIDGVESTGAFTASEFARLVTEDGRLIPPESPEPGMLLVGGPLSVGYYKDPVKSEATFQVIEGQRYARTGDWGHYREDGSVVFLGRGSGCINSGGEKVFPEEVEEVLKLHPEVVDSAVLGIPDDKFGEKIVALVERTGGRWSEATRLDEDALIAHVRAHLAAYKAPKLVVFVDSVERSPTGKLDYVKLREVAEAGEGDRRGAHHGAGSS